MKGHDGSGDESTDSEHSEEDEVALMEWDDPPIRYRRKFAANLLLEHSYVLRNLNVIRSQLAPLFAAIVEDACYRAFSLKDGGKLDAPNRHHLYHFGVGIGSEATIHKMYLDSNPHQKQKVMDEFVRRHLGSPAEAEKFWSDHIGRINTKLADKLDPEQFERYKFQLFDEHIDNVESLDIDRFTLPLFEHFVMFFFVESDRSRFERVETDRNQGDDALNGDDRRYYKLFLESWRTVPSTLWYNYHHDIVLLELVLRHGVDCGAIVDDLEGPREHMFKIRLQCNERKVQNDRFYEFKRWCSVSYNIWHRLKYVTNGMCWWCHALVSSTMLRGNGWVFKD